MAAELLAGLVGLLFVAGVFVLPVAFVVATYAGVVDIGFTSAVLAPNERQLPSRVVLDAGEQPEVATNVDRSKWKLLLVVGAVLLPIGWGVPLMVYGWRLRNRPQYVFTTDRLVVEDPDGTASHALDDISQVQTGSTVVESLLNLGHVRFSIDRGTLVTVGYLNDAPTVADHIDTVVTDHA